MAEILIRAWTTPSLTRGSILAVKPDGFTWGTEEYSNRFVRVSIPGVDPSLINQYLEATFDENGELIHKRRFHMNSTIMDTIEANGGDYTIADLPTAVAALVDKDA